MSGSLWVTTQVFLQCRGPTYWALVWQLLGRKVRVCRRGGEERRGGGSGEWGVGKGGGERSGGGGEIEGRSSIEKRKGRKRFI